MIQIKILLGLGFSDPGKVHIPLMKGFWNSKGGEHKALPSVVQNVDAAIHQINCYPVDNVIEEKSSRHVATAAKFLDDKKSKGHAKSGFALFQTSSILFNFL